MYVKLYIICCSFLELLPPFNFRNLADNDIAFIEDGAFAVINTLSSL